MSVRFLDTNILIRWLTADDKKKADRVSRLLERASERGEPLFVADMVIAEAVWVLTSHYKMKVEDISQILRELLVTDGLIFENPDRVFEAVEIYEDYRVDYIDGYLAAAAREKNAEAIISFDRDFDKIPGLKRVEP